MGELTKAQREILEVARDKGTAYAIYDDYNRLGNGGATARCIRRLMARDLLSPLPGKKFGTITEAGRAALHKGGKHG